MMQKVVQKLKEKKNNETKFDKQKSSLSLIPLTEQKMIIELEEKLRTLENTNNQLRERMKNVMIQNQLLLKQNTEMRKRLSSIK